MQTDVIQPVVILTPASSVDVHMSNSTPTKPGTSTLTIPSSLPSSTRSSPISSAEASDSDISDDDHSEFQEAEEYRGDLPTPPVRPLLAVTPVTAPVVVQSSETHIEPMQVKVERAGDGLRGLVLSDSSSNMSSAFSSSDEQSVSGVGGGHSRRRSDSLLSAASVMSSSAAVPALNTINNSNNVTTNISPPPIVITSTTTAPLSATSPPQLVTTSSTSATTPPSMTAMAPSEDRLSGPPPPLRKQLTLEMLESPQHQQMLKSVTPSPSVPHSPQRTAEARSTLGLNWMHRLFHSLSPTAPATPHSATDTDGSPQPHFAAIKVKTKQKSSVNVLTGIHETQRFDNQHVGPIWAITIAPDASYIATGGQDSVLRLWPLQPHAPHLSASPIALSGHKSDIIDLSFAPSHFVLSASIDHTVRLWHPSKHAALSIFQHPDFVTAVNFNPLDDRTFASVCFDRKVRVWSIMDHRVTEWTKVGELCTACRYDRTGRYILVGTHVGTVAVIRATGEAGGGGMNYVQELNCRNRSGKYKKGKKVTGIDFFGHLVVVTTNDSRLRIFDMNDETDQFTLVCKLKGVKNESLQIQGKFNDDGTLVLCGSDDGQIAVWQVPPAILQPASRRMQVQQILGQKEHSDRPVQVIKVSAREQFQAMTGSVATCAQFLPRKIINDTSVHHVIVAASSGGEVKLFEDRRM